MPDPVAREMGAVMLRSMRWHRQRSKNASPARVPRGWFYLGNASEADLSESQRQLLKAARERLEALSPARARPEESWASLEPNRQQGRPTDEATLWLCVPIEGKRHKSLQVGFAREAIIGGWQDRHYAWDSPRGEAFRAQATGATDKPIAEALDWVENELRSRRLV